MSTTQEQPQQGFKEINELVSSLSTLKEKFEQVEKLEINVKDQEAEILQHLITHLLPVMRFIDSKIKVFSDEYYNGNNWQGTTRFAKERGIELGKCIKDVNEDRNSGSHGGWECYLTRSGKIIQFTRTGEWSNWQNSPQLFELIDPVELTPREYLDEWEGGLAQDINNILSVIKSAVQKNEKKGPQLQKRVDILTQLKTQLNI